MKIVVTGNAGFMGSHLADLLKKEGHNVLGLDDLSGGFEHNVSDNIRFYINDLADSDKTTKIIKNFKPDVLFHLAADATEGRSQFTPISATKRNLLAYINTLTGAIQGGVKRVILFSSMSVYGAQKPPFNEDLPRSPEDVYATNKAAMERVTEVMSSVHGYNYVIIRPHNVFGERQNLRDPYRNVAGIFINRILRGLPPIIYGDGEQTRAFTYIENVTPYMAQLVEPGPWDGNIINVGPTESFTINHLAEKVLEFMESDLKPIYYPARPLEVKHAYCTADKAERILGYRTKVSFETGLYNMVQWAKSLGPQELIYLDHLDLVNDKTPKTWSEKQM